MSFFGYGNLLGWLAFLSIIPFLLIVMRRPKARDVAVPTLMFFEKQLRQKSEQSFLKKIPWTWLFIFQLISILLLSLFFVEPYLVLGQEGVKDTVVLVLDTSASMSAHGVFEEAKSISQKNLGSTNTIILAGGVPRVILEEGSKSEAKSVLRKIEAGSTNSPLGDALVFAEKYVSGNNPVVVVVSDFLVTGGTPPGLAKASLENKGASVLFFPIENYMKNNVGITDITFDEDETKVFVTNYGSAKDITIDTPNGKNSLHLNSGETSFISLAKVLGVSLVSLAENDDFMVDNNAHVVIPKEEEISVFIVTNEQSKYISAVLSAMGHIKLNSGPSSVAPPRKYDVYLLDNIGSLPPTTLKTIEEEVLKGAGVIIISEKDSSKINYGQLLPLSFGDFSGTSDVAVTQENKITLGGEFGSVSWHYATNNEKGVTLITGDSGSLLQLDSLGDGKRVFLGVGEESSNFQFSPFFPVFWSNLIRHVSDAEGPEGRTVSGGTLLSLQQPAQVIAPSGPRGMKGFVVFDEGGVWKVGNKEYGVSLLNEKESSFEKGEDISATLESKKDENTIKKDIATIVLVLVILLLFCEFLLAKKDGEF